MDPPSKWPLRKTAIGTGDDAVGTHQTRQPNQTLGNKLRVFDHIGGMTDHAGQQHLAFWQLHRLPHAPFVLVTRVRHFE